MGIADYRSVTYGEAIMERNGFAKAVVEREGGRILGFHKVGPRAAMLMQAVVGVMAN